MPLPTIDQAMGFCNAEPGDEAVVQMCMEIAVDVAADYLNRKLFATHADLDAALADSKAGDHPLVPNSAVLGAILMICAHCYANREAVVVGSSAAEIPMGAKDFLRPHRIKYAL